MRFHRSSLLSVGPGDYFLKERLRVGFPYQAEAETLRGIGGAGIGDIRGAALAGIGEFWERQFFTSIIGADRKISLRATLDGAECDTLVGAYAQLTNTSTDVLAETEIPQVAVTRISDDATRFLPLALLRLGSLHDTPETFWTVVDSTGCAVHVDQGISQRKALYEYLERQCLLRFWLTKEAVSVLEDWTLQDLPRELQAPVAEMLSNSTIQVVNISSPEFSGYCCFAFLLSDNLLQTVQFASALGFSGSPTLSFARALEELWQVYLSVYEAYSQQIDIEKVGNKYQRDFLHMNRNLTADKFRFISSVPHEKSADFFARPRFTEDLVTSSAVKVTPYVYSFQATRRIGARNLFFTRIFSPDFFCHIDLTSRINLLNPYSTSFHHKITTPLETVPFP